MPETSEEWSSNIVLFYKLSLYIFFNFMLGLGKEEKAKIY